MSYYVQSCKQVYRSRYNTISLDALDVLCAQLTRDLFAIAKFLALMLPSLLSMFRRLLPLHQFDRETVAVSS